MLIQILSHTPLYVWAILGLLVWRGVVELREREVALRRMLVLPLVMLVLSLHDMALKFGLTAATLLAWVLGCAAAALLAWKVGRSRIVSATAAGRVVLRGSAVPLAMMLAIFLTKYLTAVTLAIRPGSAGELALAICAVYGVFNGWFLGRLLRDVATVRAAVSRDAADCGHSLPARRA